MEVKHIRKLYEAMETNGYSVLELELGKSETLKLVLDQSLPVVDDVDCVDQEEAFASTQIEIRSDKVGVFSFTKEIAPGDLIKKGEILGTVKGISFQEKIKCSASGKIASVNIKEGEVVDYGKLLILVEID
jgi:biotin carboxyl carrier protein